MLGVRLTGDWMSAATTLVQAPKKLMPTARALIRRGGEELRRAMIQGIDSQAPGGKPFQPLAPLTLAKRRLTGRGGDKALIAGGDLRNAITAQHRHNHTFVGVSRKAKAARTRNATGQFVRGRPLFDVARVHEYGAQYTIKITPKMRRFLAVLAKASGRSPGGGGGGASVIKVTIPPRPFIEPTVKRWRPRFAIRFRVELLKALFLGARQRSINLPATQLRLPGM